MSVFNDKVCMVTGAASGIGKALCSELIKEGARCIIAADANSELLESVASQLGEKGTRVISKKLDVTDYDAFKTVVEDVVEQEGRLDFSFNNAGITIIGETRDLGIEHWRKVLNVNLNGVVHGTYLAYQQMVRQGSGHIVNTSSIQGVVPMPIEAPYITSKFGVMGISQALRVEGAGLGVKVSVVCPGLVKTAMLKPNTVKIDIEEHLKSLATWDRFSITPEGCARVILTGVKKNKPIITVTAMAKFMWWLSRISPSFTINLLTKDLNKLRPKVRLSD